ncbi:hypothetical protein PVNG_04357 [Plasmodium vivax North Korean]|uniref:Uncharacterized protein n=1 Tax=Plasmodium vivax North Korean TaxID=1035514 RepID=A0A0J9WC77_PLAVI|nr:hypothetical protein PVNG_04357 [Plasmodium vivax North Korean]
MNTIFEELNYIFYDHIEEYLSYDKLCDNKQECDQYKDFCDNVGPLSEGKENDLIFICTKLHCLIKKIFISTHLRNEDAYLQYLNYWLNYEFYLKNIILCPTYFYGNMIIGESNNQTLRKLRTVGHYIDIEELKKMYSLYHLYDYYNEMNKVLKSDTPIEKTVMSYANKCVEVYRELDSHCYDEKSNFCTALTDFKGKYEKTSLKHDIAKEWEKKSLPPLNISKEVQPQDPVSPVMLISTSITENGSSQLHKESLPSIREHKEETSESEAIVTTNPLSSSSSASDSDIKMPLEVEPQNYENNSILGGMGTHKITGTAIASLGASSIFFLFYKVKRIIILNL